MKNKHLDGHQDRLLQQNINMNPTRIELELTEQCNLACRFCYNSQKPIISGLASEIIKRLSEENVMEIVLTGGEPMIHPQFKEILAECCAIFSKVMVQTNGTYITEEYAQLFSDQGIFGVNISLHGMRAAHESLTCVQGSYDSAIRGIKSLLAHHVRLASNFVLTNENVASLEETIDYLYTLGLREITLTRFTPTGVGMSNSNLAISRKILNNVLRLAEKKRRAYKGLHIIMANSVPYCGLDHDLKMFCEYCHFGTSRFYVDVNGNVLMCGMSRVKLGNIFDASFKNIKDGSLIYKKHVCGADVPEMCMQCKDFDLCRGGCRAAAYARTNSLDGADPYSVFHEKLERNDC